MVGESIEYDQLSFLQVRFILHFLLSKDSSILLFISIQRGVEDRKKYDAKEKNGFLH